MQYYGSAALLVSVALMVFWRPLPAAGADWLLTLAQAICCYWLGIQRRLGIAAGNCQQFKSMESGSNGSTLNFTECRPQLFNVKLKAWGEAGRVR